MIVSLQYNIPPSKSAGGGMYTFCHNVDAPQNTKNCDANCDALWYNFWKIKDNL